MVPRRNRDPLSIVIFRIFSYPHPYRVALTRALLQALPKRRPHYYLCLLRAARTARAVGLSEISAIEFGVAGGNGLLALQRYARLVRKRTGVTIRLFGFDMGDGEGLPATSDPRDMPYFWKPGFYKMDEARLSAQLEGTELIVGHLDATVEAFALRENVPPVGVIFVDVDYYSSSRAALMFFQLSVRNWLPRVVCYFDDIEVSNRFNGEAAAIDDFNLNNPRIKIARTGGHHEDVLFGTMSSKIFTLHDFDHPDYFMFEEQRVASNLDL